MKTRKPLSFVTAIALGLAAAVGTVDAATSSDVPAIGEAMSARVRFADLDLATASGQRTLQRRIAAAIDRVCALPHAEQLSQRARVAECRADAQRQADARVARLSRRQPPVAFRIRGPGE